MNTAIICGGRRHQPFEQLGEIHWLEQRQKEYGFLQIFHGAASGADAHAALWARTRGRPLIRYIAS